MCCMILVAAYDPILGRNNNMDRRDRRRVNEKEEGTYNYRSSLTIPFLNGLNGAD